MGSSRQGTHRQLTTHSPSHHRRPTQHDRTQQHDTTRGSVLTFTTSQPHGHLLRPANTCKTTHFFMVLSSTQLLSSRLSSELATSTLSLSLPRFHQSPPFSNLFPHKKTAAQHPLPHLDLKLEIMPALVIPLRFSPGGSNDPSPERNPVLHLPSCPPSFPYPCQSFPITFLPFHAETDPGQPSMQNVVGPRRWPSAALQGQKSKREKPRRKASRGFP